MSLAPLRAASAGGTAVGDFPTVVEVVVNAGDFFDIPAVETNSSSVAVDWGDGSVTCVSGSRAGTLWGSSAAPLRHYYQKDGTFQVLVDAHATGVTFGGGVWRSSVQPNPMSRLLTWGRLVFYYGVSSEFRTFAAAGDSTFSYCRRLYSAELGGFPEALPYMFSYTSALASVLPPGTSWPAAFTTIPEGCFEGCAHTGNLVIPNWVDQIHHKAFANVVLNRAQAQPNRAVVFQQTSAPSRIDHDAFRGMSVPEGTLTLQAMNLNLIDIMGIGGEHVSGVVYDSSNPLVVTARNPQDSVETWFSVADRAVTWAPWGMGSGTYVKCRDYQNGMFDGRQLTAMDLMFVLFNGQHMTPSGGPVAEASSTGVIDVLRGLTPDQAESLAISPYFDPSFEAPGAPA